jgi:hypothetical protein
MLFYIRYCGLLTFINPVQIQAKCIDVSYSHHIAASEHAYTGLQISIEQMVKEIAACSRLEVDAG